MESTLSGPQENLIRSFELENNDLRKCNRNLVAISTLPAIWGDANRQQISESFLSVVHKLLELEVVALYIKGTTPQQAIQTVQDRHGLASFSKVAEWEKIFEPLLQENIPASEIKLTKTPDGLLEYVGVRNNLGVNGVQGFFIAGARRKNFPSETERLLLNVAANQLAIVLERRQIEDRLTFERNQLETLFQQSPAAMVLWSGPDFVFEKVNPLYQAIFPDRQLQGRPFLEACPEFKDQPFVNLLKKVLETGEPFVGREVLARHSDYKDGPLVDHYYDFTYMRVNDAEGKPYGVYDHAIDVTDRVRTRQTIQNQNIWLEEVLNRLPLGLVMAEPKTAKYRFVNEAAAKMMGQKPNGARPDLNPDKLLVRDVAGKVLSDKDTPSARAARGEELVNEIIILDKGNERLFVSCNSTTIPSMPGHEETVLVPFIDVSDLKAKESELEKAVRTRDEFLSIASHELKTPVTSLKLQVQIRLRRLAKNNMSPIDPHELEKFLQVTEKSVDRLSKLIDEMLDISRISHGKLHLQLEEFDLSDLVRDVVERFSEQFIVAGCTCHFKAPDLVLGTWDRFRIEQVITNLLTNAIKYSPGKPIEISVTSRQGSAILTVRDQGDGIASENLDRVFERFERAVTGSDVSGLGLGLYICREILKAHKGEIWAESEKGRGSTFWVKLPLKLNGLKEFLLHPSR